MLVLVRAAYEKQVFRVDGPVDRHVDDAPIREINELRMLWADVAPPRHRRLSSSQPSRSANERAEPALPSGL